MEKVLRRNEKVRLLLQLHKALPQMRAVHRAENSIYKKLELTY